MPNYNPLIIILYIRANGTITQYAHINISNRKHAIVLTMVTFSQIVVKQFDIVCEMNHFDEPAQVFIVHMTEGDRTDITWNVDGRTFILSKSFLYVFQNS